MDPLKDGNWPSSEALLPVNAGEKTSSDSNPTTADNRQRPASVRRMACARRTIMVLSLCTLVLLWLASVGAIRMPCHKLDQDHQATGEVLESSSFSSFHDLLHRYFPEKFPHGVFPSEHNTAEVVQQATDAPLATSNVQLAKRQSDNSTTSGASATPTTTPSETSTPPTDTSSSTTVPLPPTTSSSHSSTSAASQSSTSSVPPATTSRSSSTAPASTSSSSLPGTSSSLSETTSSPTSSSGSRTSSSLPSSSVAGETTMSTSTVPPSTTATRPSTSKAIIETLTSTHPNGAVVTITTTTYVPADEEPSATSTRPVPTLQNFAVRHGGSGPTVAGAVGVAVLFLAA